MRAISDPSRLLGLDVARGLAVLGMFGAHLGAPDEFVLTDPGTWAAVVHGRSSILFAVLAGVSIALLSGGRSPLRDRRGPGRRARARSRIRITVRALVIFLIGVGLTALDTNILVILEFYAVMFLLALPMLRWRSRSLFLLAGVWAIVSPVIVLLLGVVVQAYALDEDLVAELFVSGGYPVIVWMTFLWFGMGIGRLDLTSTTIVARIAGAGLALAAVGTVLGILTTDPMAPVIHATFGPPGVILEPDWSSLLGMAAHSGTSFEIVASSGVAALVIALCLLIARPLRAVLFPVESVGATALSAYSLHVVAYALLFPDDEPTAGSWGWFALTAVVLCSLWRLVVGRGPLELVLHALSVRAADGVGPRVTSGR